MVMIEDKLLPELRLVRLALADASAKLGSHRNAAVHRALAGIERSLRRPLRLAILGEGNSGKSLLINYLLRHQVLPSGGFSGDSTELLIRHADEPSVHSVRGEGNRNRLTSRAFGRLVKPENRMMGGGAPAVIYDATSTRKPSSLGGGAPGSLILSNVTSHGAPARLIEVGLPLDFLKKVEFIEVRGFPGENPSSPSVRAFRQVDLTIWCTLATQAWKETEVVAWKRIPEVHRRSALMLVTYKDAIRHGKDDAKLTARLRHATASLFGEVVLVSLRDAVQSLLLADGEDAGRMRMESNVGAAENALIDMIRQCQTRRLQKAARMLHNLAARIVRSEPGGRGAAMTRDIAMRLDRLAKEFFHASPSISLSVRAA